MKIINHLGNEYKGTIGKSVTASSWKGRNYLKKWFKPTNPKSTQQQIVRSLMQIGNSTWHAFNSTQKRAYFWFERYRKKNVSPFNAMIGSYITIERASPATYVAPAATPIEVVESVAQNPIDGAKVVVKKAGQATEYLLEYTDATGNTPSSVSNEDANYDMWLTATGYVPRALTNQTAVQIATQHEMVAI